MIERHVGITWITLEVRIAMGWESSQIYARFALIGMSSAIIYEMP